MADGLELIGIKKELYDSIAKRFADICRDYTINVKCKVDFIPVHGVNILVVTISCLGTTAYYKSAKPIAYFRDSLGKLSVFRYKTVYKYMSLESFILNLYKGIWLFSEPTRWNDRFERRFYCANFSPDKYTMASKLFATCVTKKQNNEAAWKVYAHGLGLGAHCVQLELDVEHLREEFDKSSSQYDFQEREVSYKTEYYILNLHRKENIEYPKYFNPFSLSTFISLLSLKRDAYKYEDEVRFFAIPKGSPFLARSLCGKGDSIDIPITWKNVIKRVRVDKACTEAEITSIRQACFYAGINPVFKSRKYSNIFQKPKSCTSIDFELYSIDDMPKGSHRITIE